MPYKYTDYLKKRVYKELRDNGTLARIDGLKARNLECAIRLGYASAQEAYNALGKQFLKTAKEETK